MCILFLSFNNNPGPNEYRLVIASNRDEFYARPTVPAKFWATNPDVIGGVDLFQGKVGGTWLGISKTGQFGVLTNYRESDDFISLDAKGRGHLVTDFLNSNKSVKEYISEIKQNGHQYNGFNLLVGQISSTSESEVACYCNQEGNIVHKLEPGVHCLSNRLLNFPWPKVVYGKEQFREAVDTSTNEDNLIEKLFGLLNERRRHFPNEDDSCYNNNPRDEHVPHVFKEACRAIFTNCQELEYGTRTNTVILVKDQGQVTYIEKTLADGAHGPDDGDWLVNRHEFKIKLS